MATVDKQVSEFPSLVVDGGALVKSGLTTTPNTAAGVTRDKHAGVLRKERFNLTDFVVAVLEANDYGGTKLCDLPVSSVLILGANVNLVATGTGGVDTLANIDLAIGSLVAAATPLATTSIDTVPKLDSSAGGVIRGTNVATESSRHEAQGTASLFVNISDVISVDGTVVLNGTIDLWYLDLGETA